MTVQQDQADEAERLIARLNELGYQVPLPTTTATVSLPIRLKNQMTNTAKSMNLNFSEAVRKACEQWLAKPQK